MNNNYLSDNSTGNPERDFLYFSDFRPALKEIITNAQTPLTVGVFGAWGSGKTSLMQMLRDEIEREKPSSIYTVWFTAWKYDRHDALWRAFMLRILRGLYPREDGDGPRESRPVLALDKQTENDKKRVALLGRLEETVYNATTWNEIGPRSPRFWQLLSNSGKAGSKIAAAWLSGGLTALLDDGIPLKEFQAALEAVSPELIKREKEQLFHMEQFEETFAQAVSLLGEGGRLVVFVDDLDRCLPEKAIGVLEAIKLFLEAAGVVFVLGMDREVIERGIEVRYGSLFRRVEGQERAELPVRGDVYLQKIVQIPFHLPVLATDDIERFIEKVTKEAGIRLSPMTQAVFARGLFPNPRQVKRALNIFRLLVHIAEEREDREKREIQEKGDVFSEQGIAWPLLAKTVVVQTQYPQLYQQWRQYPTLLQSLEAEYTSRPISEAESITGRMASRQKPESAAAAVEEAAADPEPTQPQGGIMGHYQTERQRYALLARMLAYPPAEENGSGRELARFAGLKRSQMAAYVRLAGAVETEATPTPVELPADLLAEMLSGEMVRVRDAVARWQEKEAADDQTEALRARLTAELQNEQQPVKVRAGVGVALAAVGDRRPGVGLDPETGLPDIAWGEEIPARSYTIGGDDDAYGSLPKQEIKIKYPYQLSKYPITNAQFQAFVEAADFAAEKWWQGMPPDARQLKEPRFPYANHPREMVSWYQATAFCRWLSAKLGHRIELPHEYEWEVAARRPDGRFYPWGNQFDQNRANTKEGGIGQPTAVGLYPANALGLHDLSGNVWEWCRNKDEPKEEEVDSSGDGRVVRGGSWLNNSNNARAAYRHRNHPDPRYGSYGFRVVLVRRSPSHQNDH